MSLMQASKSAKSKLSGKKASQMYLEYCANGGLLPKLDKQDKFRATQVINWFDYMATSDEKVTKIKTEKEGRGGLP